MRVRPDLLSGKARIRWCFFGYSDMIAREASLHDNRWHSYFNVVTLKLRAERDTNEGM
jgi:hypothetical protein